MKKNITALLIAITTLFIAACDEESPYSGYIVNFSFDKSIHPYNQVNSFGDHFPVCATIGW